MPAWTPPQTRLVAEITAQAVHAPSSAWTRGTVETLTTAELVREISRECRVAVDVLDVCILWAGDEITAHWHPKASGVVLVGGPRDRDQLHHDAAPGPIDVAGTRYELTAWDPDRRLWIYQPTAR